jgi:hypothetical protein
MSRSLSQKIYSDVFARWPKQALRPDHQLQDVLGKAVTERFQNYKPSTVIDEQEEDEEDEDDSEDEEEDNGVCINRCRHS